MILRHDNIGKFFADASGGVAVIVAVALPILIGMAGLSLEYGSALLIRSDNQRIVDSSAYAAAVSYAAFDGDAAEKILAAENASKSVARLNGIDPGSMTLTLLNPTDIEVAIRESRGLLLSRVINGKSEMDVVVRAVARLGVNTPGTACLLALLPTTGAMSIFGAATVEIEGCTIGGNSALDVRAATTSNCASPAEGTAEGCSEWVKSPPFPDPFNISWAQALLLCEAAGRTTTDLETVSILPAGPHCIAKNAKLTGNGSTTYSGDGVSLFFAPGVEMDAAGTYNLTLKPSPSIDLSPIPGRSGEIIEGLLLYGPEADLRNLGNAFLTGIGCFGITMRTVTIGGNASLTGKCPPESTANNGDPKMTKARLLD